MIKLYHGSNQKIEVPDLREILSAETSIVMPRRCLFVAGTTNCKN